MAPRHPEQRGGSLLRDLIPPQIEPPIRVRVRVRVRVRDLIPPQIEPLKISILGEGLREGDGAFIQSGLGLGLGLGLGPRGRRYLHLLSD